MLILSYNSIKIPFSEILYQSYSNINVLKNIDNNKYEKDVLRFIKKKAKYKDYFIDIGSHYGFYSLKLHKMFQKIHIFEANPISIKILKYNLKNLPSNKFTIRHCFVGDQNTMVNFLVSKFSFISQIDKYSFLSDELNEFCREGFYYNNTFQLKKIKKLCYKNLVNENFFYNFIFIFFNLLKNFTKLNSFELQRKLDLVARYIKHYDRYICRKIKIKSLTIDTILKKKIKNCLIKIDVEGAESKVLRGAKKFIKVNKPDIFCEISHNHKKIINQIVKMGYKYVRINWKSFYFEPINY